MTSVATEQTTTVKPEEAPAAGANPAAVTGGRKCPLGDGHFHREDVRKVWKECQEESLWYRALPLSVGSMGVTAGLIYNGIWKQSKRFGPFPKLAVAGLLGFAVGKASYIGTCRRKMQDLGLGDGPGFGPWSKEGFKGPFNNFVPGHRSCGHVCEECKKTAQDGPTEVKN